MSKVTLKVEIEEEVYKALLSGYEEPYSRMFSDTVKNATPITECDDCVSRIAVKNGMIKYGFHAPDMTVTEFVEDLPPVLPKPLEYEKYVLEQNMQALK